MDWKTCLADSLKAMVQNADVITTDDSVKIVIKEDEKEGYELPTGSWDDEYF